LPAGFCAAFDLTPFTDSYPGEGGQALWANRIEDATRVAAYAHSYKYVVKLPPDVLERLRWMGEYPLDHM